MAKLIKTDICIIGGGLVGQTAALAFANLGFEVALCAPEASFKDQRTTALLMDTVTFFQKLGIWKNLDKNAYPLKTMRIVDGTNRLFRSQQVDFRSSEIGLEAFGYNVLNSEFMSELETVVNFNAAITKINGTVEAVDFDIDVPRIIAKTTTGNIEIEAGFVVGADGRNSILRQQMNVGEREWSYPQTAIVLDFEHQFSSQFTSTEFHTESGPFTIVPRSDKTAGLVWMETPANVEQIITLPPQELTLLLEKKMQSFLGKLTITSKIQSFPIKGLVARKFGENNYALIGEAAHVFPPIGAQGFNLGIRDIETLADVLSRFTNTENRGSEYSRSRLTDINLRTFGVDMLNRSLLSNFLPVQMLRGAGLQALNSIPPLRKTAMKLGISHNFQAN